MKRNFSFILSILLLFANGVTAQPAKPAPAKPLVIGKVETIRSAVLNESRIINMVLPAGYHPDSATRYPVIYLLDGTAGEDLLHVAGIVQFLTMINAMPPAIVAGIANVDRKRDFTFPTQIAQDKKDFPTTGGSEKFIKFLKQELQPFVQKKYKCTGDKLIIGQSLGGLLATEILLKQPDLFTDYVIVSPSLWWNNESLLTGAPALLQHQPDSKRWVSVTVGKEGKQMEDDARGLHDTLKAAAKPNMQLRFSFMPEENHATILHNAVYQALAARYAKKTEGEKE
jgi:uncharacterized protein